MITAQAARPPASPVGWLCRSSLPLWTIRPRPRMFCGPSPSVSCVCGSTRSTLATPSAPAWMLPRSPA
nr:MAG TPA: hypothetical protein [Inoviridae sp.]